MLLKNKIYVKIQREKLYKLRTQVYFNNIVFFLKNKQSFVRSIFFIVKKSVLLHEREFLSYNMFALKETRYSLKSSALYKKQFIIFL